MFYKRETLIKARGSLTQTYIASLCGVEQQTYSHWEVGRSKPSIEKMIILEKIFGIPKEELFPDIFNSFNELEIPVINKSIPCAGGEF